MVFSEIADAVSSGIKYGVFAIIVIILIFVVVIPIASMTYENREEISDKVEEVKELGTDVAPQIFDAAKIMCEIDDTVLSQLKPNTIESYMLNNVEPEERIILENWKKTGKITACEIKILDENLSQYYKDSLNLKSASKSIVGCNLVDCFDKYQIIDSIESQEKANPP